MTRRSNPHTRSGYTQVKNFAYMGASFEILLSTTNGSFTAWTDTGWITANSLNAIQDKLRKFIKSSRQIEIPITLVDDCQPHDTKIKITDVILFGTHSRTGRAMYRTVDGSTEETGWYGKSLRRLTGPEKGELAALFAAQRKAVKELEDWLEGKEVSALGLVQEAQNKLATSPPAEDPAGDQPEPEPEIDPESDAL